MVKCKFYKSKHTIETYRELQPEDYPDRILYHCYDCGGKFIIKFYIKKVVDYKYV
jgi:hypothetical protein